MTDSGVQDYKEGNYAEGRPVPLTLSGTPGDVGVGEPLLRFVHISDTHITAYAELHERHAVNSRYHPNDNAEKLIQALNDLPFQPDFVLNTGDSANEPEEESHKLATGLLRQCRWPMFNISGNHESGVEVRKARITTGKEDWQVRGEPPSELWTATGNQWICWERKTGPFELQKEREPDSVTDDNSWTVAAPAGREYRGGEFAEDRDVDVWRLTAHGQSGARGSLILIAVDSERDPDSDTYDKEQTDFVSAVLDGAGSPCILAVHHPANVNGSPWHDYNMRLQNGNTLHDAIKEYRESMVGVFSGHSHEHGQWSRDGIGYYGVQSSWYEHISWPAADRWFKNRSSVPAYQVVTVWPNQTHVRQYP